MSCKENMSGNCGGCESRTHSHEILGSVIVACQNGEAHNHRFAGISEAAIPVGCNDHVHEYKLRTDTYDGHCHEICGRSSGAITVGDRHVHFIQSATSVSSCHQHELRTATLINDPIEY